MSETKHTPGPWAWGADDYSMAWLTASGEHGEAGDAYGEHVLTVRLCRSCQQHVQNSGEAEQGWRFDRCATINAANARLIAAAPEMLSALKLAMPAIRAVERIHEIQRAGYPRKSEEEKARRVVDEFSDMARAAISKAEVSP